MKEIMPIINEKKIDEEFLKKILLEKGFDDQNAKELLMKWTIEQEKEAEFSKDYNLAQISLNIKRARLYFSTGNIEAALEAFDDAYLQAWNEHKDKLCREIEKEIELME